MARSKLTPEDKANIVKEHNAGVTMYALAKQYNVAAVTIKRVVDPEHYAEHLARSSQYMKDNSRQLYKKATKRVQRFTLDLNRVSDARIIEELSKKDNFTQYIRELVLRDIQEKEKNDADK